MCFLTREIVCMMIIFDVVNYVFISCSAHGSRHAGAECAVVSQTQGNFKRECYLPQLRKSQFEQSIF